MAKISDDLLREMTGWIRSCAENSSTFYECKDAQRTLDRIDAETIGQAENVELNIPLVDEQGKKLSGGEFAHWMGEEMAAFIVECDDDKPRLPSE
jgi:hypothetical protein